MAILYPIVQVLTNDIKSRVATLMLTKGVSIESVSSTLGHTNMKTTQVYGKILEEKVIDEMSKINEQLIPV